MQAGSPDSQEHPPDTRTDPHVPSPVRFGTGVSRTGTRPSVSRTLDSDEDSAVLPPHPGIPYRPYYLSSDDPLNPRTNPYCPDSRPHPRPPDYGTDNSPPADQTSTDPPPRHLDSRPRSLSLIGPLGTPGHPRRRRRLLRPRTGTPQGHTPFGTPPPRGSGSLSTPPPPTSVADPGGVCTWLPSTRAPERVPPEWDRQEDGPPTPGCDVP